MATSAGAPSASAIVATAEQYVGYPYASVGDDPSTGFSCIGFVHFVFAQNGVDVPEDLATAYGSAPRVNQNDLQLGDLVFFQNTVWAGISHVDIYVGNGKMIGADNAQTGVEWDTLSDAYWQEHYLGATRPLSNPTTMPVDPSATPVDPSATPAPSTSSAVSSSGSSLSSTVGMTVTTLHDAPVYSNPNDAYTYDTYNTYTEIDMVTPSMPLTVVRTQGQWVNVSYDGGNQYGWVQGADLNLQGATGSGSSSGSGSSGSPGPNGNNGSPSSGSGTPSDSSTSTSATGATVVTQGVTATVYDSPSTNGAVRGMLNAGAGVAILQAQGSWDQVALPDGTTGWVDDNALDVGPAHDPGAGTRWGDHRASRPYRHVGTVGGIHDRHASSATVHEAVVTAAVLFVRDGPDQHARILRRVHAGDRLSILGTLHGWDHVSQRDGSRGWVSAQWVQATDAA